MDKKFYKIVSATKGVDQFQAIIELDPAHPLYEGHFPGRPILPGACLLQVVKDLAANILDKPVQLIRADDLKFMQPVIPTESGFLEFIIKFGILESNQIQLTGSMQKNNRICFKFKAVFL